MARITNHINVWIILDLAPFHVLFILDLAPFHVLFLPPLPPIHAHTSHTCVHFSRVL